jgi:Protein of unknown function (DUF4236)
VTVDGRGRVAAGGNSTSESEDFFMGFRFRRSIRILPGLRLNIGKRDVSTSVGGRGHWITFGGKRAPTVTLGVPGTGLRYSQQLGNHAHVDPTAAVVPPGPSPGGHVLRIIVWLVVLAIAAWTFWIARH